MSPSHAPPRALPPFPPHKRGGDGRVLHRAASENHCRRTKRQPPKNYIFNVAGKVKKQKVLVAETSFNKIFWLAPTALQAIPRKENGQD